MRRWRPSAVRNAAERAGLGPNDVELLTAATTLPDVMGPGHASMVHGELGYGPLEIATAHGICSSGMMALKNAYLQVAIGEKRNAICVASEFASRGFKSTRYDEMRPIADDGSLPMETAFLRYMLSDGAGAAVIENAPAASGISLRIDWISLTSYANTEKACMYFGSNDNACDEDLGGLPDRRGSRRRRCARAAAEALAAAAPGTRRNRRVRTTARHGQIRPEDGDLVSRALLERTDEDHGVGRVRPGATSPRAVPKCGTAT